MSIAHHRQRSFPLALFVLAACFLALSQFALRVQAGIAAQEQGVSPSPQPSASPSSAPKAAKGRSTLRKILGFLKCNRHKELKERELYRTGAQLPRSFNMSDFSFTAFVKGNWPVVVNFELEARSSATITFEVKDVQPFIQELTATGTGQPREVLFNLPERFGDKPQAALITIKAVNTSQGAGQLASFRLYAFGAGPQAVGSVTIDEVDFQPGRINTRKGEQVGYSFHSRNDYIDVSAEFWIGKAVRRALGMSLVYAKKLGPIRRDGRRSRQWDGKKSVGRGFSIGAHQLHLNARTGSADWLLVWSGRAVIVD